MILPFLFGERPETRLFVASGMGLASGVCLDFRESISNTGMREIFGTMQPAGRAERKAGEL